MSGTLGYATVPIQGTDYIGANAVVVSGPFFPTISGVLGNGYFYFADIDGSGARSMSQRLTVYLDNAGVPGALVGVTDEITCDQTTTDDQWITCPTWVNYGGAPTVSAATKYWVGPWQGHSVSGATIGVNWDLGAPGDTFYDASETYSSTGNPPNIPGTDSGTLRQYGVYFDVAPSAQPVGVLELESGLGSIRTERGYDIKTETS